MGQVVNIQLFHRDKDNRLHSIDIPPESQDPQKWKMQLLPFLRDIRNKGNSLYWYVVLKVRKDSGEHYFRTQVGKTLF